MRINGEATIGVTIADRNEQALWLHRGIARFLREIGTWQAITSFSNDMDFLRVFSKADIHGMILWDVADEREAEAVARFGVPTVKVIDADYNFDLTVVAADNFAIGVEAAEHLLSLGLRRLGYVHAKVAADHSRRRDGFLQAAKRAGANTAVGDFPQLWQVDRSWADRQQLSNWVRSLGLPCGLMLFSDFLGVSLINDLRQCGLRVPDDVAVVGVDDDEMACEYCRPTLSSVDPNYEKIGYTAAKTLHALMQGSAVPGGRLLIPPSGVIERASTQSLAVADPAVAASLSYLRKHMAEPIGLAELARRARMSERMLLLRFQKALGRSPMEELRRMRVDYCKKRLVAGHSHLLDIAAAAGFVDAAHLCRVFKKFTGLTPGQYRAERLRPDG